MNRRGMNYDVGTFAGKGISSRETLDPAIMQREIDIIKNDLHCTAIRISGQDITRLTLAAEYALRQGLEVWFSPAFTDANEQEMLAYFVQCAQAAEHVRQQSPQVVFVVGCELTLFMQGLVEGNDLFERIKTLTIRWGLLKSLLRGSFKKRLNTFLAQATAVIREQFHGQLTYASGPWEEVDWTLFDIVSIDAYRDAANQHSFRKTLRTYFQHGKPVVISEFGCCTYKGAEDRGSSGWVIVDRNKTPRQLQGLFVRDEQGQARYLLDLLDMFQAETVDGAFVFTFVSPSYPSREDPLFDLDMASFSLVKTFVDQRGTTYPDLPWEPKESFRQVANYYASLR
jgi:hypothetical protein